MTKHFTSYQRHLNILTILFLLIISLSIGIGIMYVSKNIQQINHKIDNGSTISQLNNAIWSYQDFLNELTKNSATVLPPKQLIQSHKKLYTHSLNLIHQLLITFETFKIKSNHQENQIITSLYDIQKKISEISFFTDQYLYRRIQNQPHSKETLIQFLSQHQEHLHNELQFLSVLNENNIKSHLKSFTYGTIFTLSLICFIGFSLFLNFKQRLLKNIHEIGSDIDTKNTNEIDYLINQIKTAKEKIIKLSQSSAEIKVQLNEKITQVKSLTEQLIYVQENERQNISQFIHNDLGQHLTALNLEASNLESKVTDKNDLNYIKKLIELSLNKLKEVSKYIHPPQMNQTPFSSTVRLHAKDIIPDTIDVTFHVNEFNDHQMSTNQKLTLFRSYQEGLTNIIRHANATKVSVSLKNHADHYHLIIEDNGRGLQNKTESTGLSAIKHRVSMLNGSVQMINNASKPGARLDVKIPITS